MDRVRPAFTGDADHLFDRQVGGDGSQPFADAIGLVRLEPMQAQFVFFGKDRDRLFTHFIGRAHDANGDLTPVCDKNFREFGHGMVPQGQSFGSPSRPHCAVAAIHMTFA